VVFGAIFHSADSIEAQQALRDAVDAQNGKAIILTDPNSWHQANETTADFIVQNILKSISASQTSPTTGEVPHDHAMDYGY
jgi:hypothetical protein